MTAARTPVPGLTIPAMEILSQAELAQLHDTLTAAVRVVGLTIAAKRNASNPKDSAEWQEMARRMWAANPLLRCMRAAP